MTLKRRKYFSVFFVLVSDLSGNMDNFGGGDSLDALTLRLFKLWYYLPSQNSHFIKAKSNQIFHYTRYVLRRTVLRVGGAHFLVITPEQHSFFQRNVAAVASCWQLCFWFDRPEIWTSDLLLQRRARYRSTNWPVFFIKTLPPNAIFCFYSTFI